MIFRQRNIDLIIICCRIFLYSFCTRTSSV